MRRLFAFYCRDGENAPVLRERLLQEHLDHVERNIERYAVAGPLKRDHRSVGSLLVIAAHNKGEARTFFETDPYFGVGVWQEIEVEEFTAVAGTWVGGATWNN